MSAAIFDNPATMAREAWQNGRVIYYTQAMVLVSKGWRGHSSWPFYMNIGPWEPGQIIGDPAAISQPAGGPATPAPT